MSSVRNKCLSTLPRPIKSSIIYPVSVSFSVQGRVVFAGGCSYAPYELSHKTVYTSQISSIYSTPGIVMAQTACNIGNITEGMFLMSAQVCGDYSN